MKLNKIEIRQKLETGRDYNGEEIARAILENSLEKELFKMALDKDPVLSNRAMWILWHCSNIDYERIKPFINKLIEHLNDKSVPSGVIRCILGLFQEKPVPLKHETFMLDRCFAYIVNTSQAIGVRVFAITVGFNISKKYPEIMEELKSILLHLPINEESPGIRARINNTLKQIEQYQRSLK